jgi:hypothetical protein
MRTIKNINCLKAFSIVFIISIFLSILGTSVISIGAITSMPDCNHEEADTRIVVHLIHAIQDEHTESVVVRTVDTDVIVILIGKYHHLKSIKPSLDLWVAFGMGRNFSFIRINDVCTGLGEERSRSLPVFHALSGCDTTSSFYGKGKKSAWQAWQLYPDITPTFQFLGCNPFHNLSVDSDYFKRIERFTIILYDKSSPETSINKARLELFCKNNRAVDKLPPTQVNMPIFLASSSEKCFQISLKFSFF